MASPGKAQKRKSSIETSQYHLHHYVAKYNLRQRRPQFLHFLRPHHKKPPEKISWQERAPNDDTPSTLLVDLTLIQTSSGKKSSNSGQDWKWWHASVPGTLRKLYLEDGFRVVVISNQAGISLKTDPKSSKARLVEF
ncbi:hypothetical protein DID88_002031 [Monilinia fructigena]|uniref:Uncharacterized protein n=1 Tax=Monilinia fructigena TaxID=38457 RepID=A0A395IW80_9HELO|nr:hypothetical protein DID88_002031 [Monilinia fructigena]